jgi:uncharacterized protein (TIGR02145 family)
MKRNTILSVTFILAFSWQLCAQVNLNLKVFLEGPFTGTDMSTALNAAGLIPLNQPYNVSPWNYPGNEQVSSIPNSDIVDWVLVELRETTGGASTATPDKMINRQAAFIQADGSMVGIDGSSMITYSGTLTANLYVIIRHRNHLAIMSSGPLTNVGGIYSWDFTDQLTKAYLDGQKYIIGGHFGMIGGDCNASGRINSVDEDFKWTNQSGKAGYYSSDLNLDLQVNNIDKDSIWYANIGRENKLPEGVYFICGFELFDDRDGQYYNTVLIGTQCWMAENLNIGIKITGFNSQTDNSIIEKYCYYDNTANCDTYGGLYQWNEMMEYSTTPGVQGICPAGWHLPTNTEWTILTNFLGGANVAGGKMKTTGTIEAGTGLWLSPNYGATNLSGFSALPGGYRHYFGNCDNLNYMAYFFSSSEQSANYAWALYLYTNNTHATAVYDNKNHSFSIRCIRD